MEIQQCWQQFSNAAEPAYASWQAALSAPAATQQAVLLKILADNCNTAFGQAHDFSSIHDIDAFRRQVPVSDYTSLSPWLQRAQTECGAVLTKLPPLFFERTSGNSAAQKRIPYTRAFLEELQRSLVVWLAHAYRTMPGLAEGRAYWSMSPSMQAMEQTANGIAVGSASDLSYLDGSPVASLASTLLAPALHGEPQFWRRHTLFALLEAEDLAFISVWSPTFLSTLLRPLFDSADPERSATLDFLMDTLSMPRRRALRAALEAGHCGPLWPRLAAISCWMDGPSQNFAAALRLLFPQVPCLPKGLFATEGVVSLPFGAGPGCPLAIQSHYLEFLDDLGEVHGVESLQADVSYQVLLTTGGGLYRYALGDRVRVTGFSCSTPRISFVGRGGAAGASSDLVGEKLSENDINDAFAQVLSPDTIACLVPCVGSVPFDSQPYYVLLIAGEEPAPAESAAAAIDMELQRIFHYGHARNIGQLGAVRARILGGSPDRFAELLQHAAEAAGVRAGDVKPRVLINHAAMAQALLTLTKVGH